MIKYIKQERARYWPISTELMAQYNDGSHTEKAENGNLYWLKNDQYHRDGDKPAYISAAGNIYWCQNDQTHRDGDKPAIIGADGTLQWCQNSQWHRFRGPAIIYPDGTLDWWINDENITQEVNEWLNRKPWRGTPEQIFEFQLRFI